MGWKVQSFTRSYRQIIFQIKGSVFRKTFLVLIMRKIHLQTGLFEISFFFCDCSFDEKHNAHRPTHLMPLCYHSIIILTSNSYYYQTRIEKEKSLQSLRCTLLVDVTHLRYPRKSRTEFIAFIIVEYCCRET